MAHLHNVIDTDTRFTIDPITRQIKNVAHKKVVLVQNDHNSEVFTFECPRTIEGHDMSLCNEVEIHYLNTESKGVNSKSGFYTVQDFKVDPEDESKVVCSWVIDRNATGLVGSLVFLVRYKCKEDKTITYDWHSEIYKEIRISDGINADERFEGDYVDVIDRWKDSVMAHFTAELAAWKARTVVEVKEEAFEEIATERKRIDLLSNYVTPQMFGAKGDGVTDDTEAFQAVLNTGASVYVPDGIYMINGTNNGWGSHYQGGIRPISNSTIVLSANAILKCLPNNNGFYNIIGLENVKNVTIIGGQIIGDVNEHVGTSGEFGFGIGIFECENICIKNIEISNCWGDGIILDSHDMSTGENNDVTIDNCIIHDCRRQGVSVVIGGKNNRICGCHIYNISGTAPKAGIDIEPNGEMPVTNLLIDGCTIHDTDGASIVFNRAENCLVSNCNLERINHFIYSNNNFVNNCNVNAITLFGNALNCSNSFINNASFQGGTADFSNCVFTSTDDYILDTGSDGTGTGEHVKFNQCTFKAEADGSRIAYFHNRSRIKNIEFNDCDFYGLKKSFILGHYTTKFSNCRFHVIVNMSNIISFYESTDELKLVIENSCFCHEDGKHTIDTIASIDGTGAPTIIICNNQIDGCKRILYSSSAEVVGHIIAHDNIGNYENITTVTGNTKYIINEHDNIVM